MKRSWLLGIAVMLLFVAAFTALIWHLRTPVASSQEQPQLQQPAQEPAAPEDSGAEAELEAQRQAEEEARRQAKEEARRQAEAAEAARAQHVAEVSAAVEAKRAQYDYDVALALLQDETEPELTALAGQLRAEQATLVRWPDTTTIPHIFFHSLIVDTDLAFDGDFDSTGYNLYMATCREFADILEELYRRGYVLVDIHDVARPVQQADGSVRYEQGEILLPPARKPIVLSQDDTNYYAYMQGDGFATRLAVLPDGSLTCEYRQPDGTVVTGDYDLAPMLETFLREHPDFSYRGARAIIGVTGYEGVYGYRTHPKYEAELGAEAYAAEVEAAKAVTQALKAHGYCIASHSFGHPAYGQISAASLATDVQKWEQQVQPITGETDVLLYPYGSDIAGVEAYSGEKFDTLYAAGYRYFCNVDGGHDAWVQIHAGYVRQGRRNIDGYRMYHNPELLDDLFDSRAILDPARPLPVPSI